MEKQNKKVPEWRKEAKVGLIVTLAAVIFFGGTFALANANRKHNPSTSITDSNTPSTSTDDPSNNSGVVNPIHDPLTEILQKPFSANTTIAHYYYDMTDDLKTREMAVVPVPGQVDTYQKSVGVDYVYTESFSILASCSGTVIEKANDSIYGNMLLIEHASGVRTLYCSLGEVNVNKGATVKQGDIIATSGESTYTSGLGQSLHFEVINTEEQHVNPEKSYTQLVKSL